MWDSFASVDVEISGVVPAPPHAVWAHVSCFGELGLCMTPVNGLVVHTSLLAGHSERHIGARRILQIGTGCLVEELTALDHENQTIAFKLVSDSRNINPFPASFLNHKYVIKQRTVTTTGHTFIEISGRFMTEHPMVGIMAETCECLYESIIHGLTERLGGAYLQAVERMDSFCAQSPQTKPQDTAYPSLLRPEACAGAARLPAHSIGRRSSELDLSVHSGNVNDSLRSTKSATRPAVYPFDVTRGTRPSLRSATAPIGSGGSKASPPAPMGAAAYAKDSPPGAAAPAFSYMRAGEGLASGFLPAHPVSSQSESVLGAGCLSKLQSLHVGMARDKTSAEPDCAAERKAGGRPATLAQDCSEPFVHTPKQKVVGPALAAPWLRHPADAKAACGRDGGLSYA